MRMRPKQFKPEELEALRAETAVQTTSTVIEKSADPEHFPVFDIPVNGKVLIYVPNHTVVGEDGEIELRMDKPLMHNVTKGKRFMKIRCIRGLSSKAGFSADSCPLCDGESEPWALANEQIKEQCRIRGLDPNNANDEAVKTIKREQYSKRVIKAPDRYYTFPIVVLETDPADIKKIVYEADGTPKHRAFWYTISQSAYEKKWEKALEGMEDEPTHPGGEFFILNYTYESKSGEYNKRDSARELQVVPKKLKGAEEFAKLFDKETEEWDDIKAKTTVIENMFYEEEDIKEEVDSVLAGTREKLAIYESAVAGPALGAGPAFNLTPPASDDGIGGMPLGDGID